jgi:xanthine dehydrogenase large subunit
VDDVRLPPHALAAWVVTSPHAHARITSRSGTKARVAPGIHGVFFAEDIPGENQVGPVIHDEPLFAEDEVHFRGQSVALVVGESLEACRKAAALVEVSYEPLPAILTLNQAISERAFLSEPHVIRRGDVAAALASAPLKFSGEVHNGGQDHFYLETHVSVAFPEESGSVHVLSSTQHPSEVQAIIAHVLGVGRHQVRVEVPRMGGGFGGKETQAAPFAAMAALAAVRLGRPVKVWLNRDQDMEQTGKRHPFQSTFEAGFDAEGRLLGLKVQMFSDGGWSNDLSRAILDRALFHLDNAYFLPHVELTGRVARTHLPSNTAFRGFGGPQGMLVIEEVLCRAAERLGLDPADIRRRNYYGAAPRHLTHYGQEVKPADNRLERIHAELCASAQYTKRQQDISAFNATARHTKRGLGFGVVKFGISFTTSFLNQAGALVHVYSDGTVQLNHGGTEMGQGLHTKMLAVCAHGLGVPVSSVRAMNTATDKVPNTSATAASSGTDLNGEAVRIASETLRERLAPIAARLLKLEPAAASRLRFEGGRVFAPEAPTMFVPFKDVTAAAYLAQVSLSATGHYRTPDIHYDRVAGRGKPFHYYAYGGALVEVEVSALTGEYRLRQVDILHDVGDSLVPTLDKGQVEGAFLQGWGWLTCEELRTDDTGRLLTHSPDTYKIPAVGDAPEAFHVALLEHAPQHDVVHGSKAVGEPPLMLALTGITALRQAISAFGPGRREVSLSIPATPEAVLRAVEKIRLP